MCWKLPDFYTVWQILFLHVWVFETTWLALWGEILLWISVTSLLSAGWCLEMAEIEILKGEVPYLVLKLLLLQDQQCMCLQRETARNPASQGVVVITHRKPIPVHSSDLKDSILPFLLKICHPICSQLWMYALIAALMMERWYN